ncbi:unnamed protein product, partial [Ectocarpus sp. 12 AP-2014]
LRLSPPCGYSLADCVCGASSSPPPPVHAGSLGDAIEAARKAAAAAAAATAREDDEEEEAEGSPRKRGFDGAAGPAASGDPKRRRGEREGSGDRGRGAGRRGGRAPAAGANSDNEPLDEQVGKNALELARRRAALREEGTGASGVGRM